MHPLEQTCRPGLSAPEGSLAKAGWALFVGLHRLREMEHRTVGEEADHMADLAEGLRTAVADVVEGIDLGEERHMAVAEVEDKPAVVDMGYARVLRMAAAVVEGTALAVVDIHLAARGVVGDNAPAVVPAVVDIRLAAHNFEEGQWSRHSLAEVDNLVTVADILEEGIAGAEAADSHLLICKYIVLGVKDLTDEAEGLRRVDNHLEEEGMTSFFESRLYFN